MRTKVRIRRSIIYDSYISMENMLYRLMNYSNNYSMHNFKSESIKWIGWSKNSINVCKLWYFNLNCDAYQRNLVETMNPSKWSEIWNTFHQRLSRKECFKHSIKFLIYFSWSNFGNNLLRRISIEFEYINCQNICTYSKLRS